jgi:hypothetical protein
MDLALIRVEYKFDGVFGEIRDIAGEVICCTLEHAYADGINSYIPKVPEGTYICKRGMHQLEHMTNEFETFEITNVPDHTDILFHTGNFNGDSAGCVLLGMNITNIGGRQGVASSKAAFNAFMKLQDGVDEFTLIVLS